MNEVPYRTTGDDIFRPGESVYINIATEEVESHLHAHNFIEIAYVASGMGRHIFGNEEYSVSKGDLFVINYDVPHEFGPLPDPGKPRLVVYNCIFKPGFLDYKLVDCRDFHELAQHFLFRLLFPQEDSNPKNIILCGRNNEEIDSLYHRMYDEYASQRTGYVEILRAYIIELLVHILRLFRNSDARNEESDIGRQKIVKDVIAYMRDNYDKQLRLEELSMMSFFSRNYFCKLFKDSTGSTVSEYIQKIRMDKARRLLKSTDKTILEISQEVGYKDIKFFNELFKRNTGETPGSYRKKG